MEQRNVCIFLHYCVFSDLLTVLEDSGKCICQSQTHKAMNVFIRWSIKNILQQGYLLDHKLLLEITQNAVIYEKKK